jgi:tetratricopeptide (TPR) repeat protein
VPPADWKRALDHGLALADAVAERAEEALPSLERARTLAPERPEPELALARLALALGRTDAAVAAAERAEHRVQGPLPAALLLRATALYRAYRFAAARAPAEALLALLPDDRAALSLAARVRGVDGDAAGALAAADRLLALDPEDPEGHYQRALALRALGRDADADAAEARYVRHRAAVEVNLALRDKFRALAPRRADEPIPVHTHMLAPE